MRVGIIGAGGVGGYFGAQLAAHGHDVVFVARGAHLDAIRSAGLKVVSEHAPVHIAAPNATDRIDQLGPLDLVLIGVKLWDTDAVGKQIAPLLSQDSAVLSLQNGVTKDDILRRHVPHAALMGASCYISAAIEAPGVIKHNGALARIVFGEFGGQRTARATRILDALVDAGIDAELSTSIEKVLWEKFAFLVGLSAVTSTTRKPVGVIRVQPRIRRLLQEVMAEVVRVGQARGVHLRADFAAQQMAFIDTLPYEMTSSMLNDLENGRRLELPWLSDSVVEMGREAGIATPRNDILGALLAPYVDGQG
jgi:2-dehydropantoate 2-reductase